MLIIFEFSRFFSFYQRAYVERSSIYGEYYSLDGDIQIVPYSLSMMICDYSRSSANYVHYYFNKLYLAILSRYISHRCHVNFGSAYKASPMATYLTLLLP